MNEGSFSTMCFNWVRFSRWFILNSIKRDKTFLLWRVYFLAVKFSRKWKVKPQLLTVQFLSTVLVSGFLCFSHRSRLAHGWIFQLQENLRGMETEDSVSHISSVCQGGYFWYDIIVIVRRVRRPDCRRSWRISNSGPPLRSPNWVAGSLRRVFITSHKNELQQFPRTSLNVWPSLKSFNLSS